MTTISKMKSICRLCTSALPDISKCISIHDSADLEINKLFNGGKEMNREALKYMDLILMITNEFDVTRYSCISDQMCELCASNLKQFYIFKEQIEKANDIFADMLTTFELKTNIEVDSSECIITDDFPDQEKSQDFPDQEKSFNSLNLNVSDDIKMDAMPSEIVGTEYVLTENTGIAKAKTSEDDNVIVKDKIIAKDKNENIYKKKEDSSPVKILPSKFTTNTKQLPPEEQAKWQKKLEFWIKKQTKQYASHNEHKYICENCGKIYSSKYALQQHEYVHTGIMNFECLECGRKFGQKKLLNAHMQIKHIKTKFFTCTKCGRVFNRSSTLAKHRWVHEDVRPYKCEYCEKTFKWKTCYKLHLNTHTKEITYNCYLCNKVYESRASRRKHCIKFHNGLGRAPIESTLPVDRSTNDENK